MYTHEPIQTWSSIPIGADGKIMGYPPNVVLVIIEDERVMTQKALATNSDQVVGRNL